MNRYGGLAVFLALGLSACSDDSSGNTGDSGQDVGDASADSGGDVGQDPQQDPTSDPEPDPVEDTALDVVADTGADDIRDETALDMGSDGSADVAADLGADAVGDAVADTADAPLCAVACVTPNPSGKTGLPDGAGMRDQRVVIQAVDIADDIVVLRNISGSDVDISGWDVCRFPAYAPIPVEDGDTDFMLEAGTTVTLHVNQTGTTTATDIFMELANLTTEGDLLISDGSRSSENDVETYVKWGSSSAGNTTRRDTAQDAGIWTSDDSGFIELCETHAGFAVDGAVDDPANWTSQPGSCL